MVDEAPKLFINNVVCSANLGMRFQLSKIVAKSHRKAYLVSKKACVVMKISEPKSMALLFASGKIICSGATSENAIREAAKKFTQIIQNMDYPGVTLLDFHIQNVVGSYNIGFRIKMEKFAKDHEKDCTYEPELHPAVIYRLKSIVIHIFVSGKTLFTGTHDTAALHSTSKIVYQSLLNYKDQGNTNISTTDESNYNTNENCAIQINENKEISEKNHESSKKKFKIEN